MTRNDTTNNIRNSSFPATADSQLENETAIQKTGTQSFHDVSGSFDSGQNAKFSPYDRASWFSKIFFTWPFSYIQLCAKSDITESNLPVLSDEMLAASNADRFQAAYDKLDKLTVFSLWKYILLIFWKDHLILILSHLIESAGKIASALTLSNIIQELDKNSMQFDKYLLWQAVILNFLSSMFKIIGHHHVFFRGTVIGCKTRTALTAFLYSRILSMKISSKISSGKALNFISNDLQRFENVFPLLHYSYIAAIECLVIFIILKFRLKFWSMIAGVFLVFLMLFFQLIVSYFMGIYQERLTTLRDDLTKCISDSISGILAIKCFNWESYFERETFKKRSKLYSYLRKLNILEGINVSLFYISSNIVSFGAFIFLLFCDKVNLEISLVTVVFSFFGDNALSISYFLPIAIQGIFQINITLRRFIDICEEIEVGEQKQIEYSLNASEETCISYDDVSISWSRSEPPACEGDEGFSICPTTLNNTILSNLNFSIEKGELVGLVGPVGSGKSTILLSMLDELNISNGCIKMLKDERISYTPQVPWMLPGTIRENILLGRKYIPELYDQVVSLCCLEKDLSSFPERDMKLVGEKGISLSGGQKARICLARTFYEVDASIYLLDDVMSAVDSKVSNILFRNISNYLQRTSTVTSLKTCILVTHQLQYLKYFDKIIVLNKDGLEFFGTFYQLLKSNCEILNALEEFSDVTVDEIDEKDDNEYGPEEMSLQFRPHSTKSEEVLFPNTKIPSLPRVSQLMENDADTCNNLEFTTVEEAISSGSVSLLTYKKFLTANSKPKFMKYLAIVFYSVVTQIFLILLDKWIFAWPKESPSNQTSFVFPAKIFLLCIVSTIFLLLRAHSFLNFSASLAHTWFKKMTRSVYNAPMKFFIDNPHGRIMNRFISDQTILDEYIGSDFFDTFQCTIYAAALISFIVFQNIWVLVILLLVAPPAEFFRRRFINASRKTKRIESVLRSPVYSLLSCTLQGLPVIRSLKLEMTFNDLFVRYLDANTTACFNYYGTCRWFGFFVDVMLGFFNFAVTILMVFLKLHSNAAISDISQSLSYSEQLIGLVQWILRQSSEVENLMTSTERVMEYCNLELDDPQYFNKIACADKSVSKEWPRSGNVILENMHLAYPSRPEPVLKGISLEIEDGEKVALVGRTGAGKSSLLFALFRIFEPYPDGSISINSLDTTSISKHRLREAISIIPQEPIIFRNSIRFNLDPAGKYTDEALWNALNKAQMKESIDYFSEGLDTMIDPSENVFSAGEKQLLCLARAILANRRIVVMDEATANVDLLTTHKMQESMKNAFASSTVCTIAHRLHTIIEYDKVVVLESGKIKEVGHPHQLLESKSSSFSQMVKEMGPDTEEILRELAREHYKKTHFE